MAISKSIIISCAGMGKRLGIGNTKALVDIFGKPLIIRTLELLDECKDIRIVVGYQADKVIDMVNSYRKDITYVFNHDYMNNGTGASVSLAMKYANEYILTIDGDLLIHPQDMKKLLSIEQEVIGVTDASTDNPVLTKLDNNNNIIQFSRKYGEYEWTGVSLVKTSRISPCQGHVYQLLEPLLPISSLYIRTKEIDTMNDYENAVKWIKNGYTDYPNIQNSL